MKDGRTLMIKKKAVKRIREASATLSKIHDYRWVWFRWLRSSDSGCIGQCLWTSQDHLPSTKRKNASIQNQGSLQAFWKSCKVGSKDVEGLCKAQIPCLAPDPGDTTALRNREGKGNTNLSKGNSMTNAKRTLKGWLIPPVPQDSWKIVIIF